MNAEEVMIISNQDKSLYSIVSEVFSSAHHSHCCKHITDNMQKYFRLAALHAFWKATYA